MELKYYTIKNPDKNCLEPNRQLTSIEYKYY